MKFPKSVHYVKPISEEIFSFLGEIEWFSKCGQSEISKEDAIQMICSIDWEIFQFDRRADITIFLSERKQNEYSEWNTLTEGFKDFLEEKVFPKVNFALETFGLSSKILPSIQLDILSYMQEETYARYGIPHFYDIVMNSYRNGKLPCGWSGDYPQGKLLEF